jgi:hypothetical protein
MTSTSYRGIGGCAAGDAKDLVPARVELPALFREPP